MTAIDIRSVHDVDLGTIRAVVDKDDPCVIFCTAVEEAREVQG